MSVDSVLNEHRYETFFLPLSLHAIREDFLKSELEERPEGIAFGHLASLV